jgi:ribosomal protein L7/L12
MTWYWGAALAAIALLALTRFSERQNGRHPRSGDGPPSAERIDAFLRAGYKIEAIKEYRALHAVDLKTAKDAVEARARALRGSS